MASFRKEVRGKYAAQRVNRREIERGNQRPRSSARDEDVEGANKPPSDAPFSGLGLIRGVKRPAVKRYL